MDDHIHEMVEGGLIDHRRTIELCRHSSLNHNVERKQKTGTKQEQKQIQKQIQIQMHIWIRIWIRMIGLQIQIQIQIQIQVG